MYIMVYLIRRHKALVNVGTIAPPGCVFKENSSASVVFERVFLYRYLITSCIDCLNTYDVTMSNELKMDASV